MAKRKQNKKKIIFAWGIFISALGATLMAEYFIQIHAIFSLDGRMFFHAWYGLVMCTIIVLFSKFLGFFIKRQESYYKENKND